MFPSRHEFARTVSLLTDRVVDLGRVRAWDSWAKRGCCTQLKGAVVRNVGGLVEQARAGGHLPERHFNPYLIEAARLSGLLFTPSELREAVAHQDGAGHLFASSCPPSGEASTPACPPVGQALGSSQPVIVEVGSYLGKNLVEMAQLMPESRFLGLDITYKRTVRSAKKIHALGLTNAKVGLCDAREFFSAVAPGTVAGVCIFFPDPWPKLRQAKNRLLQRSFFALLHKALRADGFVWIKTDAANYFASALEEAASHWALEDGTRIPHEFGGKDLVTVFEELFQRQGQATFSGVLRPLVS